MHTATLLTILGMAAATYLTRIGGDLLMRNRTLGPRLTAALNAVPPAVLTAVIAPSVLAAGWPEAVAGAITAAAAFRLPLLATIACGIGTLALLRLAM
jgi:branched chain amino acid efflux pump